MKFLYDFIIGIFIGSGAILPGISAGVFCVIFGIYEKLLDSVTNLFKDFKKNFLFLLPFFLGGGVGVVLFGNIIKFLFSRFENEAKFIFIGLILGTLPSLFSQATEVNNLNKNKLKTSIVKFNVYNLKDLLPMFLAFLFGIVLIILENNFNLSFVAGGFSNNFAYLVFSGILMSAGIVVPGISNTIILMCLGVYSTYISAIASVNLKILVPIAIGVLLGSVLWIKIIKSLFKKHHRSTYYAIIGFTIGSIFVLLPSVSSINTLIVGVILCLFTMFVSYKFSKLENNTP